jgi:hypothetical protein
MIKRTSNGELFFTLLVISSMLVSSGRAGPSSTSTAYKAPDPSTYKTTPRQKPPPPPPQPSPLYEKQAERSSDEGVGSSIIVKPEAQHGLVTGDWLTSARETYFLEAFRLQQAAQQTRGWLLARPWALIGVITALILVFIYIVRQHVLRPMQLLSTAPTRNRGRHG